MPNDTRVLSANQEIQFDWATLCEGSVSIRRGTDPNVHEVVYPLSNITSPELITTRGKFTEVARGTFEDIRVEAYEDQDDVPEGSLLNFVVGQRNFGIRTVEEKLGFVSYRFFDQESLDRCIKKLSKCYEEPEDEEPLYAQVIAYVLLAPQTAQPDAVPCVAYTQSSIQYECELEPPICEEPISLSISAGELRNVFVADYTAGFGNPTFYTSSGVVEVHGEIEEYVTKKVVSFSDECNLPENTLHYIEYESLYYGFAEEEEVRIRRLYRVIPEHGTAQKLIRVFGYLINGACIATAESTLEYQAPGSRAQDNTCWVELDYAAEENRLYLSYGSGSRFYNAPIPTIRALNGKLVDLGTETTTVEKIEEFSSLDRLPRTAIFSYQDWRRQHHGFMRIEHRVTKRVFEVIEEDPSTAAPLPIFIYAYISRSRSCHGYDQLMIEPIRRDIDLEEHEVYRVSSRILITEDGVYAAPGPDYDDALKEVMGDSGEDTYLLSEITHEQGYIHRFWPNDWARPEKHYHKYLPNHPLLVGLSYNPDYYITWTPVGNISSRYTEGYEVAFGGRDLVNVYNRLRHTEGIPNGVRARWPGVRLLSDYPLDFPGGYPKTGTTTAGAPSGNNQIYTDGSGNSFTDRPPDSSWTPV